MFIKNFNKLFSLSFFCLVMVLLMSCQNDQKADRELDAPENVLEQSADEGNNSNRDQVINEELLDTTAVVKKVNELIDKTGKRTAQLFSLEVDYVGYEEMVHIISHFDSAGNLMFYEEEYGNTSGVGTFVMIFDQDEPIALFETRELPSGDEYTKTYSHKNFAPFTGFTNTWTEKEGSMAKKVKYIGAKKLKETGYQTLATVKRQKLKVGSYITANKDELKGETLNIFFEKIDSTMPGMPVNITTSYQFDRELFKDLFEK